MRAWLKEGVLPHVYAWGGLGVGICIVWGHEFLPRWISLALWGATALAVSAVLLLLLWTAVKEWKAVLRGLAVIIAFVVVIAAMNGIVIGLIYLTGGPGEGGSEPICKTYGSGGRFDNGYC